MEYARPYSNQFQARRMYRADRELEKGDSQVQSAAGKSWGRIPGEGIEGYSVKAQQGGKKQGPATRGRNFFNPKRAAGNAS